MATGSSVSPLPYTKMSDIKKEEYHSVSGTSYPDGVSAGGGVVTSQPTEMSGVENYVLNLDATQVAGLLYLYVYIIYIYLQIPLKIFAGDGSKKHYNPRAAPKLSKKY